ncbi:MAG TPA: thiamine pyrophosphate-dependent enzyme [Acidimicrobiales bacterium]|nr:thiamine pyrophosphate-dependent enzyme [Acidimicrobiales bacterium]
MTVATGGEHLVAALAHAGVTRVFGVPGESFLGVLDALGTGPVRWTTARHEGAAAFMASAFAKVAGEVAVCMGTRAVGTANLAIGVHNARQDSTPMLAVAGDVNRGFAGREAFQEVDLVAAMTPWCKWAGRAEDPARLPETVARALAAATGGRPGPAFLAVPQDVAREMAGADPVALPAVPPQPAPAAAVDAVAAALGASRRPLVFAGGGAARSQADVDALVALAERFETAVMVGWRHHDLFPNDHRLYAGTAGLGSPTVVWERLGSADLVVALGNRLQENSTDGYRYPSPSTRLIRVDIDPGAAGTAAGDLLIIADAPTTVGQLLRHPLPPVDASSRRAVNDEHRRRLDRSTSLPPAASAGRGRVSYQAVVRALDTLAPGSVITTDAGNFYGWVARYHRFVRFGTYLGPASGAMGYGLPAAIGAKLAAPDRPVVALAGDGGASMTIAELETAARSGAPVVLLVLDNRRHGTIRMHAEGVGRRPPVGTELGAVDFAAVGRGLGASGVTVSADADVAPALAAAVAGGRPAVIHCLMDPDQLSVDRRL